MNLRILVIDDEPALRSLLSVHLRAEGYDVIEAHKGSDGLKQAAEQHPHLIILDLGLPDLNGLEVLKRVRAWTDVAVLILTVDDDERTKVALLDAGADDYLTKPFGTPELLARVRVALRRAGQEATPVFESDDLMVDVNRRVVEVGGQVIKLSATEFAVLSCLVRANGKIVPPARLLNEVWGPNSGEQGHYVRVYIGHLRKKIEVNSLAPKHVITEPGAGYRLL